MEKLKELRKQKVLTLQEMSDESGIPLNTIWRLENGHSGGRPATIRKLAAYFGVEPSELVSR